MKKSNRFPHNLQGQLEFPFLPDFPTSELWQDHYERLGSYGTRPGQPGPRLHDKKSQKEIQFLREELACVNAENRELKIRLADGQDQNGSTQKGN